MAAEEIHVVVKQEKQGTALADARRDAEALEEANKRAGASSPTGGKVDWAALKAQQQQATRAMAGDSASQGGGTAKAAALERELAMATELEALQARAAGDTLGAAHLERESEIMARSLTIQRNTTMSREEALGFARAQIDAEAQITSNQKMQALEKKSSGDSAKDDSRKAAALEKETALYTNLNIARARASGDMLGAAYLEQEAEIMARASQIQRETTLSKEQAVGLARTQVGLEAQIASNIRMQAVEQRQITQEKKAQGSAGDGGDGGGGGSKISAPRAGGGGQILRNFMDAETIGKIFVAKYVFDQVFNTVASIAHAEDALAKRRYQADMESIDRTSELIRISKSTHSSGEAQSKAEQIGEELDKAKEKQGLAMPEETMGDHMKLALDAIFGEGFRDKFGELGKTNAEKGDDDDLYKKGQLENAKKLADK